MIVIRNFTWFTSPINCRNNFWKISRSIKFYLLKCIFVSCLNSFNAIAFRIENISVQGETMRRSSIYWGNDCSKSISWYFFIRIIILKNASYCFQCLQILILLIILVVKRVYLWGLTIRSCKVNCNIQINLASSKNIF